MKPVRPLYAVLIVAGCSGFLWVLWQGDFDWPRVLLESNRVLATYVLLCWVAAFVFFPATTLFNRWIRNPAVLLSNHTHTVDVSHELGFKPIGLGKRRHIAALPFNQCFQVDFSERYFETAANPGGLMEDLTPERSALLWHADRVLPASSSAACHGSRTCGPDGRFPGHRSALSLDRAAAGPACWKIAAILGNHDCDPASFA
jgi:hypothetical protein